MTQTTLERPTRATTADPGPAHLAHPVERKPPRLAVIGLICWVAVCALVAARHPFFSWHYFATAGQTLLSPGGLHVYGEHPELQFGPITMAVCALLELAPATVAAVLAGTLMIALGVGTAGMLADLTREARVSRRTAMTYAALLAPLWLVLAIRYGHLDDALALFLMTTAVASAKREHWLAAAVLLAAAIDAKPWVLPMAVLLLAAPRAARLKSLAIFVVATALPWIPFVVADPRTVQLSRFVITVADDSVLRQIGSLALATPTWDRPAQFLLGGALAVWLVRHDRWVCVPFAVLSVRLLLDPQTYLYYATGLVLAAAIADLTRRDRRPLLTAVAFGWSAVAIVLADFGMLTGAGTVRLVGLLAGVIAVVVDDGWSPHLHRTRAALLDPAPPKRVAPKPVADTHPAESVTAEETPAIPTHSTADHRPSLGGLWLSNDPPKLGRLWSETHRHVRPATSSLRLRR